MEQDLVDHRFDLTGLHQAFQIGNLEVGNADGF